MNLANALKGSAEHGGPIALSAGVAALTVALVSSGHGPGQVDAAGPRPTVTATVAAPAPEPARTTVVAPTARPTPDASVAAVSDRGAAMPHTASGGLSHAEARPPSTPDPSPAAAPCSGQVLTVRVRRAACVTIGGSR